VGAIVTLNGTTTYATSSDYRLKENVAPLTNALHRVRQLKPCTFNFKNSPGDTVEGFLAHECQEVCPMAVHGVKDDTDANGNIKAQCMDASKLIPLLTKAIQEQQQQIEDLRRFLCV
jgi:hypothetical protein